MRKNPRGGPDRMRATNHAKSWIWASFALRRSANRCNGPGRTRQGQRRDRVLAARDELRGRESSSSRGGWEQRGRDRPTSHTTRAAPAHRTLRRWPRRDSTHARASKMMFGSSSRPTLNYRAGVSLAQATTAVSLRGSTSQRNFAAFLLHRRKMRVGVERVHHRRCPSRSSPARGRRQQASRWRSRRAHSSESWSSRTNARPPCGITASGRAGTAPKRSSTSRETVRWSR